jgi:hypothetical protein
MRNTQARPIEGVGSRRFLDAEDGEVLVSIPTSTCDYCFSVLDKFTFVARSSIDKSELGGSFLANIYYLAPPSPRLNNLTWRLPSIIIGRTFTNSTLVQQRPGVAIQIRRRFS